MRQIIYSLLVLANAISLWAETPETIMELPASERYIQPSTKIPEWLQGHENLLPPVDPAVVREMPNLLNYWLMVAGEAGVKSEFEAEAMKAMRRIAALKEQASRAVVYLYATVDLEYFDAEWEQSTLAGMFGRDPTILNYTLPLFRRRLSYITEQFRANDMRAGMHSGELEIILGNLKMWGDANDRKAYREMLQLLAEKGEGNYYLSGAAKSLLGLLEHELKGDYAELNAKNERSLQGPTWEYLAYGLMRNRVIDGSGKPPEGKIESTAASQHHPGKRTLSTETSKGEQYAVGSKSWLVWLLVVIAATVGAVRAFLRKSK